MTTIEKTEYSVIGTRPPRPDGVDKVTGRAMYAADLNLPGTLHARILRSPHAHARIMRIDASKALALPGVFAVVTADDFRVRDRTIDFAETMGNVRLLAENVLASERALYYGHGVAAVAAVDTNTADEALALIDVDYEVLPAVLTVEEAMQPGAPILHPTMTTHVKADRFARGDDTGENSNVAQHLDIQRGDPEQGFGEADIIIEREFTTKAVHQGYIEPHACTALWYPNDHLSVWTSTQSSFGVRAATAAIVGLPEHRVRVVPMEIGGGFGGKLQPYTEPVAALLSRKTGRPVKHVMTRQEEFDCTGPASATKMRCRIGSTSDGRITAAHLWMAFEAGAFPGSAVGGAVVAGLSPYKLDHVRIDGFDVVCNKPKTAAYRAPGMPQGNLAVETVIDELAEKLGLDPLEFRAQNAVHEGDRTPTNLPLPRIGNMELFAAMRSHPHYKAPIEGPNRGRGIAIGYRMNGGNASSITISVNFDGSLNVLTGAVDIGGSRATTGMVAAESLHIAPENVNVTVTDTDNIGWTGGTGGSRVTYDTTMATVAAAERVIEELSKRAAIMWDDEGGVVRFEGGAFVHSTTDRRLTLAEVAKGLMTTGGPVSCTGVNSNRDVGPIFGASIVDVEVDPDTGKVDVLRFTAFADVGRAIHPGYVEGQMQGGAAQGIGWALSEEYFMSDEGRMLNSALLDYRIPTTVDVPSIETVIIEVPNPRHPLGVRGVGEITLVTPQAALMNAVSNATGVRMTELPLKPSTILNALNGGESGAAT